MILFNKFCFFLSLTTGTVIIGVINTLYGFFETILRLVVVEASYKNPHAFGRTESSKNAAMFEQAERTIDVIYTENSLYTMQFLFGIYLIYGSVKEKPSFLFANIILHVAFIVYSSCFVGFAVLRIVWEDDVHNGRQIFDELLKIPILLYFAFVIYSRHEEVVVKSPTMMGPVDRRQITDSDTEDIRSPA